MDKNIKFSAVVDLKEFDKAVKTMKESLDKMYQASDRSRSQLDLKQRVANQGLGPQPTGADKDRAMRDDIRAKREMGEFIKEEMRSQEKIIRTIERKKQVRDEMLRQGRDTLKIEQEINLAIEKRRMSEEAVNKTLEERQRIIGSEGGAGGGGLMSRFSPRQLLGGAAGIFGAVAKGSSVASEYLTAPGAILNSQGVSRSILGQAATNVISGRGFEDVYYANQAASSMEMAERNRQIREAAGATGFIGRVGAAGFGGAALGLGGGPLGALGGGILGAGFAAFSGEDSIQNRLSGKYQTGLQQQKLQEYDQFLESQKNLNPVERAVIGRYQQEAMPNLATQRQLGLGDSDLNDFLSRGNSYGFTNDMMRNSASSIIGAGGSTRSARDSSVFANNLARNFDLTNSASVIGQVSGLTSTSESGENTVIRIMSEAVMKGLDGSDFVEEQRKFAESVASVVSRSGAIDGNQLGVASDFSKFVGGNQMYQVQGARSAYELSNQLSGQSGGVGGVLKAAAFNRDPNLSKLSVDDKNYLIGMTNEQIQAGGTDIEYMAKKAGFKNVDEFKKTVKDINTNSTQSFARTDEIADRLRKLKSEGKENTDEFKMLSGEYLTTMSRDKAGIRDLSPAAKDSFVRGQVFGEKDEAAKQAMAAAEVGTRAKADAKVTDRGTDKLIAGQAAQDAAYNKTFNLFKDKIDDTSLKLADFSGKIVATALEMGKAGISVAELSKHSASLAKLFQQIGATPSGDALVPEKGATPGK